jgi:hypothetical protein
MSRLVGGSGEGRSGEQGCGNGPNDTFHDLLQCGLRHRTGGNVVPVAADNSGKAGSFRFDGRDPI